MDFVALEAIEHFFSFLAGESDGRTKWCRKGVVGDEWLALVFGFDDDHGDGFVQCLEGVVESVRTVADDMKSMRAAVREAVVDDWCVGIEGR